VNTKKEKKKAVQIIIQLQLANNALEDHEMQAQDDLTDAAVKSVSAVAQALLECTPCEPLIVECQNS